MEKFFKCENCRGLSATPLTEVGVVFGEHNFPNEWICDHCLHLARDKWAGSQYQLPETSEVTFTNAEEKVEEKPARTDGKRAVRTKSTGDRVYLVDDNAKTKAWVTSPEILSKLGFELPDVQDVEDSSLLGYQMVPSIYKVD